MTYTSIPCDEQKIVPLLTGTNAIAAGFQQKLSKGSKVCTQAT